MKTRVPPQDSSLFSTEQKARARRSDPITSVWAAQGIVCNRRQAMVLTALIQGQGTQHEIIRRARDLYGQNIAESTIRTGVSELEARVPPLVEVVGMGKAPSGKPARIYARVVR